MMLLLITTNFTASVYADDDQTADDTSIDVVEIVEKEEGDNELPADKREGETVLPAETTEETQSDKVNAETTAEELEAEKNEEPVTEGFPAEVVFVEFGARDGIGQLPDSIHALAPKDLTWDGQSIPDIKLESESVDGYTFDGWNPWLVPGTNTLRMYGFWVNGNASKKLKAPMLRASGVAFSTGSPWDYHNSFGYIGTREFQIGGMDAYCVEPNKHVPALGEGYSAGGSGTDRQIEVAAYGLANGKSHGLIQAAIDNLPSSEGGHGAGSAWCDGQTPDPSTWRMDGYGYSADFWTPDSDGGAQTFMTTVTWWPLGGYVKVYKRSAEINGVNYASSFPNNYSLAGAVYGVYSDAGCTNLEDKLTTGSSGESGKTGALDPGTYYVKEISPSPGFLIDTKVYPVSVTAGSTSSITSTEVPINDPMGVKMFKQDRRESKWVDHLDEAQFTVKYYDSKTNDPTSGTPKLTFVYKCEYNDDGEVISDFGDPTLLVDGDDAAPYIIEGRVNFPLGTFTIEESTAPQLFAADPNVYVGHITQNGELANEAVDHYIDESGAVNELTGGSAWILEIDNVDLTQNEELQTVVLQIQKVDLETGKAELPEDHITNTATLAGGVFHVWRTAEYNTDKENPELVDIAPVDYGTIVADENGVAELKFERANGEDTEDGLLPGKFKIVEEKAPNGFALKPTLEENTYVLEAPVQERNTATFRYTMDVANKLTRIQIEKLDQNGDLVSGEATATIQLIETETGRVVYEFVADGQAHMIKGLTTLMNYHLHELYVAPNYKLAIDKEVNVIDENDSELHASNDADHPYTNYYHMVDHEVEIHTTATVDESTKKEWDDQDDHHYVADGVAHIFDEVSYKNVYEHENYKLVGELWDKTDDVSLGNVVEKEFTPSYDVGIETLEFEQQLDDLDNHELVVFETLYRIVTNEDGSTEEIQVAEHKDLDDEGQTIYVDELYRADFEVVKFNADDEEEMLEGVTFNVHSYRVKRDGVVEDINLGEFTTDADGLITIEQLKEDSKLTVTEVEEKDPTWYRWEEPFIFDIGHNNTIELHTLEIENHQIQIHTTANFKESGAKNYVADGVAHIIDTVDYEWLYEGDQYKLVATLIDKGTEEEPIEEEVTTVEHEFIADGLNGSEDVEIEFDFTDKDNHDFVVFEELYHIVTEDIPKVDEEGNPVVDEDGNPVIDKVPTGDEPLVAEHKDINDENQTVHVDELYRAAMVLYKIGNGNKDIKLNGAYFNVTTKRTKRDGTLIEKDLGAYVTGGILVERDAVFKATVYSDEALTTSIRSVESSYDSNLKKQAVTLLTLPDGEYWVKVEGEEETKKYEVSKGTIVLFDQPEDTEVTFTELVAPAGYYIDRKPFIVNVGHDHELERVENYRSNSMIIITNRIPETGCEE